MDHGVRKGPGSTLGGLVVPKGGSFGGPDSRAIYRDM